MNITHKLPCTQLIFDHGRLSGGVQNL